MSDRDTPATSRVLAELAELCRNHDVSLDLIEHSDDIDGLLDRVLDEFEMRLAEITPAALADPEGIAENPADASKLRALVMFAAQASALKEKALIASELRQRAGELEQALLAQERERRRLDQVLAALDAGILVVGTDGTVEHANRAASRLTGKESAELVGQPATRVLGDVEPGGDGEVRVERSGDSRVLLVMRRDLGVEEDAEVVLLKDVTARDERVEEQHRLERSAERMRTLAVLSHKINNPLTALLGRAQILRLKKGTDPAVCKAAEVIEDSARRIADYVRELAHVVKEGRGDTLDRLLNEEAERAAVEEVVR